MDPWLYEYDENLSHSKKKALYKPKEEKIDDRPIEPINLEKQKHNVIKYLQEGETVIQALKRLSKTPETQNAFDALTEAADLCLSANFYNIYNETREKIKDSIPVTNAVNTEAYEADNELWEYKAADSGELLGPFTTIQMQLWARKGFFQGDYVVMVRKITNPNNGEFIRSDSIKWEQL